MKIIKILLLSFFIIILSSCNGLKVVQSETQAYPGDNPAYPNPQAENYINPAYPGASTPVDANPVPTSTMDPQLGTLAGRLLVNGKPAHQAMLDLAEVMLDDKGNDLIAGLDPATAPNTMTDDQGRFSFVNIKAGRYALILDIVTNQFLLNYPGRKDSVIVEVEAGKVYDLGDLDYDSLPGY